MDRGEFERLYVAEEKAVAAEQAHVDEIRTGNLEDGEELAVISRMLGHANFSTTANIYAHVTPTSMQRSADRMDGILRRRAGA